MPLPAAVIVAIAAVVVTAGVQGLKEAHELRDNDDNWESFKSQLLNCCENRPDKIVPHYDEQEEEFSIFGIYLDSGGTSFFRFVKHWHKSNELFHSIGIKNSDGSTHSGKWGKIDVKETRNKFNTEMKLFASKQASSGRNKAA